MRSVLLSAVAFAALALPAAALPSEAALNARAPNPVAPRAPQPSAGLKKREQLPITPVADISRQLCPLSMSVCPIAASVPSSLSAWIEEGFECVEFSEDLTSCGGCGSLDAQYDCTAVPGALGVSCEVGSCRVHSCVSGYSLAPDGKTCVSMQ